jgi:RHH-type proline utilization regulon transcriptional repressor/proline dehydrogenase/delta 1-pyrroline-5-carboxylate dehydrogenase
MIGMSAASLLTGNTVIIKPAEQTSLIAYEAIKLMHSCLLEVIGTKARGVINLVTGIGEEVGAFLSEQPDIKLIAFTGSHQVGMHLNKTSNANPDTRKQVITEMGGKNAIVIDETADLDEAVPAAIKSAFAYAGQKCSACSRIIIVEELYEQFMERFTEAAKSFHIGLAENPENLLPAVCDKEAYEKINRYAELADKGGYSQLAKRDLPSKGYFVSPVIAANVPYNHPLIEDEIFGPVVVCIKAKNVAEAIAIANNSKYALTGGYFSRSPVNIQQAIENFEVGNLYINRNCTGAIVARQAFGGLKQSSIGFKAGGPLYLYNFVQEKTVTENTMRKGFVIEN